MRKTTIYLSRGLSSLACLALIMFASDALAAGDDLGAMASLIYGSFSNVAKLITAGSYIAGLGFAIGAIMKFKAHKDSPQNTPIGQPIGLTFVAAALLFLPSILGMTGSTLFGENKQTAGPTGIDILK